MRHYHITRVFYVSLVAVIITLASVVGIASSVNQAEAAVTPYVPYGGWVSSLPTPNFFNPLCPFAYIYEVKNVELASPLPFFGLVIPPGTEGLLYNYANLAIPGTPILGGYELVPTLCVSPKGFPVFMIYFDGLQYLTGTGL